MDLVFVLDASYSMLYVANDVPTFAKSMIDQFFVAADQTQVGAAATASPLLLSASSRTAHRDRRCMPPAHRLVS